MLFIEPHAGPAPVIQFVRAARGPLDINTYLLTDRRILSSVRAAVRRGVRVRIIIARHPYGGRPHGELTRLRATGALVRYAPPRFTTHAAGDGRRYVFDHAKYMVSGDASEIGTANMTWSAFHRNREYLWVGHDPRISEALRTVFQADWTRHRAGPGPRRVLVLSPGATGALVRLLNAPGRVCVESEEIGRDRPVLSALRAKGPAADLLLPARLNRSDRRIAYRVARRGVHVRLLRTPYLHAKLIADPTQAFIGSENLSPTSLTRNREVGLILRRRAARRLYAQCQRDFARGFRP
ncbi:phosphatidylserine/phosphatidylglycerophosphate/cardiolipin synthase family protein [Acidiferrobacter sp.]|uniref:phospholipase D-like domain-containing protein n=1 Tax=Acidiferrobacter sp. TaxID=1872107 RepID=UPI002603CAFE|nr:phospholipase D-like domain-containing protein [Acidiferrobacter sp.]